MRRVDPASSLNASRSVSIDASSRTGADVRSCPGELERGSDSVPLPAHALETSASARPLATRAQRRRRARRVPVTPRILLSARIAGSIEGSRYRAGQTDLDIVTYAANVSRVRRPAHIIVRARWWRWGESNPRPRATDQGFSGRSRWKISPRGSHRRSASRPARVRCPTAAPGRSRSRKPAHDARSRVAGDPGRTAT
jgi:hypothetical protein